GDDSGGSEGGRPVTGVRRSGWFDQHAAGAPRGDEGRPRLRGDERDAGRTRPVRGAPCSVSGSGGTGGRKATPKRERAGRAVRQRRFVQASSAERCRSISQI